MDKHGKYRPLVAALAASLLLTGTPAGAACRQALAMGLDVSGSVDAAEYRLQLDGLAAALTSAEVQDVLLAMPGAPVRLTVFEWSAPQDQRLVLPWVEITGAPDLQAVATTLRAVTRTPTGPSTALGVALRHGAGLLAEQSTCWTRTLDISGDGRSNTGPDPRDVREHPDLAGITVNALVIGSGNEARGDLNAYFETLVIHGPDAFYEQADSFDGYEAAMIRKLLRELQGLAVSEVMGPADGGLPPKTRP